MRKALPVFRPALCGSYLKYSTVFTVPRQQFRDVLRGRAHGYFAIATTCLCVCVLFACSSPSLPVC